MDLGQLGASPVEAPASGRVVVVAPHPDDEVLGAGGTIAALAANGAQVVLIAVTNGEASDLTRTEELRKTRPRESSEAAVILGTTPIVSYALGLPDGGVIAHDVETALSPLLEPGDLVFAPWSHDGHPDHNEAGSGAQRACERAEVRLLAYLVWAWHWAQPSELPWENALRVDLEDEFARRKRGAVQCFASQLAGPEPILSSRTLCRFTRDFEVFLSS
jgi:LmbE family N-acetylglucosaminyl deacetylase